MEPAPLPLSAVWLLSPLRLRVTFDRNVTAASIAIQTFRAIRALVPLRNSAATHAGGAVVTVPMVSGAAPGVANDTCQYRVPPGILTGTAGAVVPPWNGLPTPPP